MNAIVTLLVCCAFKVRCRDAGSCAHSLNGLAEGDSNVVMKLEFRLTYHTRNWSHRGIDCIAANVEEHVKDIQG